MTCAELQELLLDHQARALPFRVSASLRFHAAFCDCCRELVRTYGTTVDLAPDLRAKEVPADVHAEVEAWLGRGG